MICAYITIELILSVDSRGSGRSGRGEHILGGTCAKRTVTGAAHGRSDCRDGQKHLLRGLELVHDGADADTPRARVQGNRRAKM